jgi:hypothetical protein
VVYVKAVTNESREEELEGERGWGGGCLTCTSVAPVKIMCRANKNAASYDKQAATLGMNFKTPKELRVTKNHP